MGEADWPKEKAMLLMMIKEKQDRLKDYERRFLPTPIDEEREVIKERSLKKEIETLKSKIDTVKQEMEVLKLRKMLKELEEENASLQNSST